MMSEAERWEQQLGQRARQRWSAATAQRVGGHEDEATPRDDEALLDAVLGRLDEVLPDPAPRSRRWVWGPTAALVAAGLAWLWWRPAPRPPVRLPAYEEVSFEGGLSQVRSAPVAAGVPHLDGRSLLRWRVTPRTTVAEPLDVWVHATGPEDRCLEIMKGRHVDPSGAIELVGSVDEVLGLPSGSWTLTLLVVPRSRGSARPCPGSEAEGLPPGVRAAASRRVEVIDGGA